MDDCEVVKTEILATTVNEQYYQHCDYVLICFALEFV